MGRPCRGAFPLLVSPMKTFSSIVGPTLVAACLFAGIGCGDNVPENPKTETGKANPQMAQQRIQDIQANPRWTQAQKDQMIATVKQKNHIQ
jgi:hypothetical protein